MNEKLLSSNEDILNYIKEHPGVTTMKLLSIYTYSITKLRRQIIKMKNNKEIMQERKGVGYSFQYYLTEEKNYKKKLHNQSLGIQNKIIKYFQRKKNESTPIHILCKKIHESEAYTRTIVGILKNKNILTSGSIENNTLKHYFLTPDAINVDFNLTTFKEIKTKRSFNKKVITNKETLNFANTFDTFTVEDIKKRCGAKSLYNIKRLCINSFLEKLDKEDGESQKYKITEKGKKHINKTNFDPTHLHISPLISSEEKIVNYIKHNDVISFEELKLKCYMSALGLKRTLKKLINEKNIFRERFNNMGHYYYSLDNNELKNKIFKRYEKEIISLLSNDKWFTLKEICNTLKLDKNSFYAIIKNSSKITNKLLKDTSRIPTIYKLSKTSQLEIEYYKKLQILKQSGMKEFELFESIVNTEYEKLEKKVIIEEKIKQHQEKIKELKNLIP